VAKAEGDGFQLFYRSYPRKKNPGDALKAWQQTASIRPPLEELLLAVDRAVRDWRNRGTQPHFIPYPASWLRAHAWLNEIDPEPDADLTYDQIRERMERGRWG
jgi:hypothetical protein